MVGVGSLPSDELTASGTGSSWVLQWAGSPEGQRRGRSVRWASRAPLLFSRSVVSDSLRPYGLQHYEHPGRSFSRVPAKVKSESEVAQSCPTLCDPVGCSLPGSRSVAISFSRGSSWPRDRTQVSHIVGRYFTVWATESQGSSLQTEMSDTGAFLPGASRVTSGRFRTLSIRFLSCKNGVITPSPPRQDVMRYDLCYLGNPKPCTQSVLSQVPWAPSPLGA